MQLILPLNFGERPCDRALAAMNPGMTTASVLWSAFLVWKDFGIARDDRRHVPADVAARAASPAVMIIEQFAQWVGVPGVLVESGIKSGFFMLVPVDHETSDLVLVDFFPANHSGSRDINNSKLGGINKSLSHSIRAAKKDADAQLSLFSSTEHSLSKVHSKEDLHQALFFIHQICHVLKRQPPVAAEWKQAITVKALDVLSKFSKPDTEVAFRWFVANRDSQLIPLRLDMVLDQFPAFIERGKKDFR